MPTKDFANFYKNLSDAELREHLYCLELVVEKSKIGTWELDVPTGHLKVNRYFADLLGFAWSPYLNVSFDDALAIIHPDDRKHTKQHFKQCLEGRSDHLEVKFRVKFTDNSWHWIRDIGTVIRRSDDGRAEKIAGSWFDIHDMVESGQRLGKITRTIPGMIYEFEMDADGGMRFPYASEGLFELTGLTPAQIKDDASVLFALIHPEDIERVQHTIMESAERLTDWFCEYRLDSGDGERWLSGHAVPERDDELGMVRWYGQIVDTSHDKTLELELQESKLTLEKAQELGKIGYWRANLTTGELQWSDEIYKIFALDKATMKPTVEVIDRAIHPDDFEAVKASMERAKETGNHDVEYRVLRPDGEVRWIHELAGFRRDISCNVMIGTVRDVTEQKLYQRELERLNITDELTKVNNRRFFIGQLEQALQQFTSYSSTCVGIIDIDHFKLINDQLGHAEGDLVLKTVAAFIREQLRPGDVFARIGGEEFALVLQRVTGADAQRRLNVIRELVSEIDFSKAGKPYHVTVTVGMTMLHANDSRDDVLHRADESLYVGKREGRNCVIWSEEE